MRFKCRGKREKHTIDRKRSFSISHEWVYKTLEPEHGGLCAQPEYTKLTAALKDSLVPRIQDYFDMGY
jgi:hypothetical protein